jgi:hypothetical protein
MKTAVEWLVNKFNKESLIDLTQKTTIKLIIEQAKEMERQQLIDAYENGDKYKFEAPAERYYNETFKK